MVLWGETTIQPTGVAKIELSDLIQFVSTPAETRRIENQIAERNQPHPDDRRKLRLEFTFAFSV